MNDKKTESKNQNDNIVELKNVLKNYPDIIGTTELSEILTDRYGRQISDRYIRNHFRKNGLFDGFKTSDYTKYNFRNPSETVNKIIERFDEIEKLKSERFEKSKLKKSERQLKKLTVIEIGNDNKINTEIVKPETVTTGTDKK